MKFEDIEVGKKYKFTHRNPKLAKDNGVVKVCAKKQGGLLGPFVLLGEDVQAHDGLAYPDELTEVEE